MSGITNLSIVTDRTTSVSILTGSKMTRDLSIPSQKPIKDWVDDAVDALAEVYRGQDIGFDFTQETAWSIARIGAAAVSRDVSLDEAHLVDGAEVMLVPVTRTERYQVNAEDVQDAVTILQPDKPFGRPDLVTWLSWWSALTLFAAAGVGIYGWSSVGSDTARLLWGVGVLVLGSACISAGLALWKRYDQPKIAAAVLLGGIVNSTVGGALSVPLPEQVGVTWLGAPQIAGGAAVLLITMIVVRGGPLGWQSVAGFAGMSAVIAGLAAVGIGYGGQMWVWPAVVGVGLLVIRKASTLVRYLARIALPPVPAPGEDVGIDELLDPVVDIGAEAAELGVDDAGKDARKVWQQILDSVPTASARLAERAALSQQLLAGFIAAGAAAITVGVLHVLQQGHFLAHSLILCILAVITMSLRAQLPADRRCVWALLTAGATTFTGVVIKLALWWPGWVPAAAIALVSVPLLVLVAVAATADIDRLDAIQRTWLQRFDRWCVAAMVPMLVWVAGLYDYLRNVSWFPGT